MASSDKAYGEQEHLPYVEDMPLNGRHPYEVSKSCADLLTQCYCHTYGLPAAIARCGNVYGGGDLNWSRIVPGTIRALLSGVAPVIRSDGTYVRDYIYVKDVARAYMMLGERLGDSRARGGSFNFSAESPRSVMDLVGVLQRLMGCENIRPRVLDNANGEIHDQFLTAAKAREILGWKPHFSLEDGLRETIGWYRGFFAQTRTVVQ